MLSVKFPSNWLWVMFVLPKRELESDKDRDTKMDVPRGDMNGGAAVDIVGDLLRCRMPLHDRVKVSISTPMDVTEP